VIIIYDVRYMMQVKGSFNELTKLVKGIIL